MRRMIAIGAVGCLLAVGCGGGEEEAASTSPSPAATATSADDATTGETADADDGEPDAAQPGSDGGQPAPQQQQQQPDPDDGGGTSPAAQEQDREAQSSLRNALTGAKVIFTDNEDYREATAEALQQMEPSLTFVQNGESTGPKVVSVQAISQTEFRAAARSGSNACFLIRDDVTGGGTTFAKTSGTGACTATTQATYTSGGWDS